jgi:hypothetical protein
VELSRDNETPESLRRYWDWRVRNPAVGLADPDSELREVVERIIALDRESDHSQPGWAFGANLEALLNACARAATPDRASTNGNRRSSHGQAIANSGTRTRLVRPFSLTSTFTLILLVGVASVLAWSVWGRDRSDDQSDLFSVPLCCDESTVGLVSQSACVDVPAGDASFGENGTWGGGTSGVTGGSGYDPEQSAIVSSSVQTFLTAWIRCVREVALADPPSDDLFLALQGFYATDLVAASSVVEESGTAVTLLVPDGSSEANGGSATQTLDDGRVRVRIEPTLNSHALDVTLVQEYGLWKIQQIEIAASPPEVGATPDETIWRTGETAQLMASIVVWSGNVGETGSTALIRAGTRLFVLGPILGNGHLLHVLVEGTSIDAWVPVEAIELSGDPIA